MKKKPYAKRLLSLILAVLVLAAGMAMPASAEDGLSPEQPVEYGIDGETPATEEGTATEEETTTEETPAEEEPPVVVETFFDDVSPDIWYAEAVSYVRQAGLFSGTSLKKFSPGKPMNRAMFVTVLGRLYGVDETEYRKLYKKGAFYDVADVDSYFYPHVHWAASYEITSGMGEYTFSPDNTVQRQQIAAFLYRYAAAIGADTSVENGVFSGFADAGRVSSYARTAMQWAITHGVLQGNSHPDGSLTLDPTAPATRAQVAQIFYNCRSLLVGGEITREPIELKIPPVSNYVAPASGSKTVAGVSVRYVEFNPAKGYSSKVAMGNNKLFSAVPYTSLKPSDAVVAVNGAFFQCYAPEQNDYNTVYSTIVSGGKIQRLDNTYLRPTLVIDSDGKASVEYFKTLQTVSLIQNGEQKGESLTEVGCNLKIKGSSARVIYTRAYGSKLEGTIAKGFAVNSQGIVTKVYKNASNVPIPADGYLLMEREERFAAEPVFNDVREGDTIRLTVEYKGSSTQDIATCLSNGPTVVRNGKAYAKYKEEGFTDPKVVSGSAARMAIGVKKDGTIVIASCSASLSSLSQVMLGLGCQNAFNLDGGASTALYANGSWLATPDPTRKLTNMLVFTKKK